MRPHTRFRIVNDLGGSTFVYTAITAGWLFLALFSISTLAAWIVAAILFPLGFFVILFSGSIEKLLYHEGEQKQKRPKNIAEKRQFKLDKKVYRLHQLL